jgi:hypothetical protein
MGIEVISSLQKEVEALKKQMEDTKTAEEKKYEELKKELEVVSTERKTNFDNEAFSKDEVANAKVKGAELHLKSILTGRDVASFEEFKGIADIVEKAIKPADVPSWLAEEFSNSILEELKVDLKVENLFSKITMPVNRNTFSIPAKVGEAQAYLIAPGDDAIESAISASKVSFQTKRIKTLIGLTDQADFETVTAIVDLVRNELIRSIARSTEKALIMGDSAGTDPNDVTKAFDGLLKYATTAGNVVDNGGGAITADKIAAVRKVLGVYGINLADVAILAPVDVAFQMIELDEVITVDKYGPSATILTGEIGKLWGMPIVVSEYISHTLKADGTPGTPGTDDKTAVLVVNKEYFAVADRGSVGVETERKAVSSSTLYVGYRDIDFNSVAVNATPVAALTNVA